MEFVVPSHRRKSSVVWERQGVSGVGGNATYVDLGDGCMAFFLQVGYNICLLSYFLHVCSSQLKNVLKYNSNLDSY